MNDRLEYPTQVASQNAANRVHNNLTQRDHDYASSVSAGHTTAWAIPYLDDISGSWCVNVKDRGRPGTDASDAGKLKPIP